MKVGLVDCDRKAPNLALMKLSAYYKSQGYDVGWTNGRQDCDLVCGSRVFTYSERPTFEGYLGGPAEDFSVVLTDEIEHVCPDYTLYGMDCSMGFLTRGCDRNCSWCIVPEKEGPLRANAFFEEFVRHDKAVFLDNNVLGDSHGIAEIERLAGTDIKVDFNQGLDARLINDGVARRLSKLKWLKPVRLACDRVSQIPYVQSAVTLLRWHNCTPRRYFVYVLVKDVEDALERVKFLKGIDVDPFAQPFRDRDGTEPTDEQRHFARWVNHKAIFRSVPWKEYAPHCQNTPNNSITPKK